MRIPVREVKSVPVVGDRARLGNESDPKLSLKIVLMPRVMVSEKIRHRDAAIRPLHKLGLKPDEAFGHEVVILNVTVEDVTDEVQVLDPVLVRIQTFEEGRLLFFLFRRIASPEMHVRKKENHRASVEN